ncbi:MAG: type II and III secretion system protein, partial [Pontiellaceae bacterium]|nr:type II and III secretion system protein [Pontiellaceae bacterium]
MIKKLLIILLCAASFVTPAQQPSVPGEGKIPRVRPESRVRRDGSSEKPVPATASVAENGNEAQPGTEASNGVSSGNQENFNAIMGSFSDLAMKFSEKSASNLDVFVYECRYISGRTFASAMEPFLSVNGELSDCEDSDLVVISDEKERIPQLKEIADSIDRPVRQVLVSASVVEFQITDGFEKDLSMQYNQFVNMNDIPVLPGGTVSSTKIVASAFATRMMDAIVPSGANPASLSGKSSYMYYAPDEQAVFSSFLTFLESKGTAEILSSPSLILRRGHTGNILSGEDIPITKSNVGSGGTSYSVDFKSVGIKLRVTPQSIFEDRVVLEVSPEVSNIIRYEESSAGRNPVVAIRNANTLLEINDGYMVSIGGLLREEQIKSERRIPILGSIPLLGTLFRASSSDKIRSQLVIFLSVKVVNPGDLSAGTIETTGVSEELQKQIDATR